MNNTTSWRKSLAVLANRLYLYPKPEPMPRTLLFWIAMGIVSLATVLFSGFYITYLSALQDAYLTHAEDLGIMDQAIWNTAHGHMLHQTICNIISDTNCYSPAGISRFAIHFEPILFLVSLFYLIAPNPKTLFVIQTIVVASGAFPAFWLARLRLRNELAAVAIALLYLLYPALLQAVTFDFHAVTFTTALFMFVLYFLYTRKTVWTILFVILAIACKEELFIIVALYGLWTIVFQRQWRMGLFFIGLSLCWLVLWQAAVHIFAGGHLLLASRYTYLGKGPLQIAWTLLRHPGGTFKNYILEYYHLTYLRIIFAPSGFLALFAPWVLVLTVPTLALNLLSNNAQMYSGMYQYNAEIVPVIIFATIEALVLLLWIVQLALTKMRRPQPNVSQASDETQTSTQFMPSPRKKWGVISVVHIVLLTLLSIYVVFSAARVDYLRGGTMPFSLGFQWPQASAHALLAQRFEDMIPSDASVSAQSSLVPHISHRTSIYLFPYQDKNVDYVFLDVSSDIYPYFSTYYYLHEVKDLLLGGKFGVVAAQDGYLLLKRGLPPPGVSPFSLTHPLGMDSAFILPNLPSAFCSYVTATPQQVTHPVQVNFTSTGDTSLNMDLIGYDVSASSLGTNLAQPLSVSSNMLEVTTYWRTNGPVTAPVQPLLLVTDASGREQLASWDFPSAAWCQTNTWQPGKIMKMVSRAFSLQDAHIPDGLVHLSMALVPLVQSSGTIMDVQHRFPLHVLQSAGTLTPTNGTNAIELVPLTIVP